MKTQNEMKDMMSVYQEINKRRQSEEMDVNSLTMFAEAWEYQKRIIDEQQKQIDAIKKIMDADIYHIPTLIKDLKDILK